MAITLNPKKFGFHPDDTKKISIKYPPEFIAKLKQELPEDIELHKLADSGAFALGRAIYDKALAIKEIPSPPLREKLLYLGKKWTGLPCVLDVVATVLCS